MEWNNTLDFNDYERIEDPYESPTIKVIQKIFIPPIILFGLLCNSLFLAQLIRRRLWRSHSGYVSLAVLLVTNLIYIVSVLFSYLLTVMDESLRIPMLSHVACKCWFLYYEVLTSGPRWSVVVLLLSAFIHLYIRTPNRICDCRRITRMFCTPLGMLILNGVIFLFLFISSIIFISIHDNYTGHFEEKNMCFYMGEILMHYFAWLLFTNKLPTLLLIPIFLIVTTCKLVREKNRPTAIPADTLDQEEEEEDDDKTKEYTWTSIGVGLATFVCFLPRDLTEIVWHFLLHYDHYMITSAWIIAALVSDFLLVIVPVICLARNREIRQFIKSKVLTSCPLGYRFGIPCLSPGTNDAITSVDNGQDTSGEGL